MEVCVMSGVLLFLLMGLWGWLGQISALGRHLILMPDEHCILHCHELELFNLLGKSNGFCAAPAAPFFSFLI